MSKRTKIWICIASAILAILVTLYPLISNYFGEKNRSLVETRYEKAVENLDTSEITAVREAAAAYNGTLLTIPEKAYSREALRQASESYDELLNIRGDGIMGYIEIPKISVNLPIYHGTEEATLDRGVGHLLGSSLPVGGIGTHCVLTGHSGLAGQKMFSDLDQLAIGDVFFLRTLGETMAYMVLDINTVLPEDTSKLTIDPARDSITLVTCTPYGVNTHRLLIRGERIEVPTAEQIVEETVVPEMPVKSTWMSEYVKGILGGLAGILSLALLALILRRKIQRPERKKTRRTRQKEMTVRPRQESAYVPKHTTETVRRDSLWWDLERQSQRRGKHEKR